MPKAKALAKGRVVHFDSEPTEGKTEIKKIEQIEEASGKLDFQAMEDKLMHSVIENDEKAIDDGNLIKESFNQGVSSFTPDLVYENLVTNYKMAKQLYGETILKALTGYDASYIEKNINIPEFKREIKKAIEEKIKQLKKEKVLDSDAGVTEKGVELAALVSCVEELDHMVSKGIIGEKVNKKAALYGDREDYKPYNKGASYRELALKSSIKTAIRRNHKELCKEDLKVFERRSRGQIYVIYAIDASGSMKGKKIGASKRAGIALAYQALQNKDRVGLIVFSDEINASVEPTEDFTRLLKSIIPIKASSETSIVKVLQKAAELFPNEDVTKHLLILTDALPTAGKNPEKETIDAAIVAKSAGITISVIGISLDKNGARLAEKIVDVGEGKLYAVRNIEEIDKIVLEDYYNFSEY